MNKFYPWLVVILAFVFFFCLFYLTFFIYFSPALIFGALSKDNNRIFVTGLARWVSLSVFFAFLTACTLLFVINPQKSKIEILKDKIGIVTKLSQKLTHSPENCKPRERKKLLKTIESYCESPYTQLTCQGGVFTSKAIAIKDFNQKFADALDKINNKCFAGKNEDYQIMANEARKKSDNCQIFINKMKGATSNQ
ncbi:MAG: hypothetical protein LBG78_02870 [Azoarcus sp.]|jgi:hypothetical protein|nr:hypothetical protein [Azoarcus sp.]